jgi:predicted kinase
MHTIVGMRLKRGRLTVADATNVTAEKRTELRAIAETWRRPVIAVVFALPEAVCQERNRLRAERTLPPQAIKRQLRLLRESLPGLAEEGFSAVHLLHTAEEADSASVSVEWP